MQPSSQNSGFRYILNLNISAMRSLKTRVLLITLLIFVLSSATLAIYLSQMMRQDMERLLGEQQFSTVSIVAAQVNDALENRLRGLENFAGERITPSLMDNPAAVQKRLEEGSTIQGLFNAGLYVADINGFAIASTPASAQRIGVNYMDRDHMIAALKDARMTVSKPVIGKVLRTPVFSMAVPIRDANGKVIGALVGVTDLSQPNFLDVLTEGRYGKSGGYLLISNQHRVIVTATDKSRIMQPMAPTGGLSPQIDRFIAGYEGYAVHLNAMGIEVLSSSKQIPAGQWRLVATLPTEEAFAPIHAMQRHMLFATIFLTLLAAALVWWLIRRQLSPLTKAATVLSAVTKSDQLQQPLPIARPDEVGALIGVVNQLMQSNAERQDVLKESEARFKTMFNEAPLGIALVESQTGKIQNVNPMFARIAGRSMDEMAHIDWMSITHPDDLQKDLDTMALMNAGKIPGFQMEKRYLRKDGTAVWINMTIAPVHIENKTLPLHLCMIEDISERKKTEQTVHQLAYYDLLTQLPNRLLLQDRLTQAMLAGKRNERYGALIFLDLDNFKSLNDTMGHSTGDLLLVEVAARLKACVREIDTVSRFGGDEFVVLLQDMSRDMPEARSQAYLLSEKICNTLAEPYELVLTADGNRAAQRMTHRCTASVGVALFLGMEMSEEDVIKRADIAMYQAKADGGNKVRFYEVSKRPTTSL
ncbi:MAG: hypothetical protein RLZZ371_2260 [Pseudomonadota bacterium]